MSRLKSPRFWIRAVVSGLLLFFVFRRVGWGAVLEEIQTAHGWYLVPYVALGFAATLVSAAKWKILSRPFGFRAKLSRYFLLYMVGYFFNHILPTSVGGDVVRSYELGRHEDNQTRAMASVLVERFTGLITLVFCAVLAVALEPRFRSRPAIVALVVAAVCGCLLLAYLVLVPAFLDFVRRRNPIRQIDRILEKVQKVQAAVLVLRDHPREIATAMLLSVLFYLSCALRIHVGTLVFGHHIPLTSALAAVPVMLVIFMIPISLGGIGLQEWAYCVVLATVGVPQSVGLSLGLLFRVRAVVFGLIGGALYPVLGGVPNDASRDRSTGSSASPSGSGAGQPQ